MNTQINKCNILGVNIAAINMDDTVLFLTNNLDSIRGEYICVSNVHTTVMSYDSDQYRMIQNEAVLALPDGKPLSVVAKKQGYKYVDRVTGPDLMEKIFEISKEKKYKHFFYGSTPETLSKLELNLRKKYKFLNIVGMYSPPFRKLSKKEEEEILQIINDAEPDFIWIGLGAPKQEIFMYEHRYKFNGIMLGVGAGFDYYAENIKRAPNWMQKFSLEWLYRLLQEPKKLFKRYLKTNIKFILLILKQLLRKEL